MIFSRTPFFIAGQLGHSADNLIHCYWMTAVPQAETGDEVLMGASRNDPGAGNLLVHLAYVDTPGHIAFFVRSFGTNNFPTTITWPIVLFRP